MVTVVTGLDEFSLWQITCSTGRIQYVTTCYAVGYGRLRSTGRLQHVLQAGYMFYRQVTVCYYMLCRQVTVCYYILCSRLWRYSMVELSSGLINVS